MLIECEGLQFIFLIEEFDFVDFVVELRKVICDILLRKIYWKMLNFLKVKFFISSKED